MTFQEYQEFSRKISERAKRLQDSIHSRGWELAATVGIPHCGCSLHNASIDDNMTGWCYRNPKRLKVAKRANHIVNDWTVSNLAERIIRRAWNSYADSHKLPMLHVR